MKAVTIGSIWMDDTKVRYMVTRMTKPWVYIREADWDGAQHHLPVPWSFFKEGGCLKYSGEIQGALNV